MTWQGVEERIAAAVHSAALWVVRQGREHCTIRQALDCDGDVVVVVAGRHSRAEPVVLPGRAQAYENQAAAAASASSPQG